MMSALYNNGQAHQTPNMAHCDTQQGAQTLLRLLRIAQRVEMDVAANEMTHEGSAGGPHRPSMGNRAEGLSSGALGVMTTMDRDN